MISGVNLSISDIISHINTVYFIATANPTKSTSNLVIKTHTILIYKKIKLHIKDIF